MDYRYVKSSKPFVSFRENQEYFINKILEAFEDYKYVVVDSPTGSGKSVIAYTIAKVFYKLGKGKSFVTVPYKTLQDQYLKDFKDLALMKGIGNYLCEASKKEGLISCAEAPCRVPRYCKEKMEEHSNICQYTAALERAESNFLTIFNTASFLNYKNLTEKFSDRYLTIFDEAHGLENNLMNFKTMKITENKELGISVDYKGEFASNYLEDLKTMKVRLLGKKSRVVEKIKGSNNLIFLKKFVYLTKLVDQINDFLRLKVEKIDETYVVNFFEGYGLKSLEFKPVVVDNIAYNTLFRYSEKVLMMSATCSPTLLKSLGLGQSLDLKSSPNSSKDLVKSFEIPTTFKDLKKRPCFIDKRVGILNNRVLDNKLPVLLDRIEKISSKYSSLKGIIHTHSYKITNFILKNCCSELKRRLISHKGGDTSHGLSREEALKKHIKSPKNTILISPMMYEGVDLKYSLGRFNIICKVPYASLSDPQIKKRLEIDYLWYQWQAILKIEQGYGRTTRAVDDWSYTFILDETFIRLYENYSNLFSKSFKQSLKIMT